jgi:hypothetical protein
VIVLPGSSRQPVEPTMLSEGVESTAMVIDGKASPDRAARWRG